MQVVVEFTETGRLVIPPSQLDFSLETSELEGTNSELGVFPLDFPEEVAADDLESDLNELDDFEMMSFLSLCQRVEEDGIADPVQRTFCSDLHCPDLPETAGKCYCDWVSNVSDIWDQLTVSSMTVACEIADKVYGENLLDQLADLGVIEA